MKITWHVIEANLKNRGGSQNEINTKKQLYNDPVFQNLLFYSYGIITERTFLFANSNLREQAEQGTITDLSIFDSPDLIRFISAHGESISYEQAASVTPQQLGMLPNEQANTLTTILTQELSEFYDPIRYSLSAIVQTGFPYQKVKGTQHFERKNGNLTVTMSAPNNIGLPSGIYPRLAFVHLCSEIVKRNTRHINLGPTLKKFVVDEMGRPWSTGKKGTAIKWRQALTSILATTFTVVYRESSEDSTRESISLKNVSIADEARLWWDKSNDGMEEATIKISEAFADALLNHATPLDIRALKTLASLRSPLAFDLYSWLTYRFWKMEEKGAKVTRIPWKSLSHQLGSTIRTQRHFIYEVRSALQEVKKVYPQAHFSAENDQYLILISSPPHILPKRSESHYLPA